MPTKQALKEKKTSSAVRFRVPRREVRTVRVTCSISDMHVAVPGGLPVFVKAANFPATLTFLVQ